MSRFFVGSDKIDEDVVIIDDRDDVKHLTRVMRVKPGEKLKVSDGEAWQYACVIESVEKDKIIARIEDKQKHSCEPETKITLFQGVPKQGKMDFTVQKCTELGVSTFIPVFMKRTVVSDKGNFGKKTDRLRTIAMSASKQCGRGIVPEVCDAISFEEAISMHDRFDLFLFPYENEEGLTVKDVLRKESEDRNLRNIAVIIGPEGGFSDEEAEALKKLENVACVSLGKTILRTETAGMAAVSMCMYELEL